MQSVTLAARGRTYDGEVNPTSAATSNGIGLPHPIASLFQVALKLSRLEVERVDLNALEPLEVKRFHLDSDLVISLILKANWN